MEEIIPSEDEIQGDSIVFPELDFLYLYGLTNLKRFTSTVYPIEFPKLRELRIGHCRALTNFVSRFSDTSNNNESIDDQTLFNELVAFSNLEILDLSVMDNWRYLWHDQFADGVSFSKLKTLKMEYCLELSVVFPLDGYKRFQRLESLSVSGCYGVEEIYEYVETNNNLRGGCALRQVYIFDIPELKHIWSKDLDMDETSSFKNLQSVQIRECPDLKYVFPTSIARDLLQLQHLKISDCGVEMIIAEPKNAGTHSSFFEWPKLKRFEIFCCDKLINLGYNNITEAKRNIPIQQGSEYFFDKVIPNVEVLQLDQHSLKAIQSDDRFPVDQLVWKLKQVTLSSLQDDQESIPFLSGFLRRIYSLEKLKFFSGAALDAFNSDHNLRLKHLELENVINLKHLVKKDSQFLNSVFQSLETLSFLRCEDLINIAPISASVSFQYLTILKVECCSKMTSLITSSTAKSMIQLEKLRVSQCEMMREIVAGDEEGDCSDHHHMVIFNKLKCLELNQLPTLNSFCSCSSCIFKFPLLEKVSVEDCNQMNEDFLWEHAGPK